MQPAERLVVRFDKKLDSEGRNMWMWGSSTKAALFAAALALLTNANGPSIAETFPNRTVKFIVAVPPGGGTDARARIVAQRLTEAWSQTVVVENRPSANFAAAAQAVALS